MKISELTPEMMDEVKDCKTPEERADCLSSLNSELTLEQLDAVSGGLGGTPVQGTKDKMKWKFKDGIVLKENDRTTRNA